MSYSVSNRSEPQPTKGQTSQVYIWISVGLALAIALAINSDIISSPLFVLGAALGIILTIAIFQKPELGGYILILTVFANLSDLFTEKGLPSINKPLVGIVMFSIFANYVLRTGKISPRNTISRIEVGLILYYLAVLASVFVAENQSKALQSIFDLTKDIAVGFCVYCTLDTKPKIKMGIQVLMYTVAIVAALGVIHTLVSSNLTFWGLARDSGFGQLSDSGELRYGGPIAESNIWGQVLVSIFPIALYRSYREQRFRQKWIALAATALILLAMFLTQSRGAVIALVMVLFLVAIDMRVKTSILFGITLITLAVLLVIPSKYTERIKSLTAFLPSTQSSETSVDESVEGRREKMLTGLAMFADKPFLGVGFANYSDTYWNYAGNLGLEASARNVGSEATTRQPHSLYIEIMAETGLFGIAGFAFFMGFLMLALQRARVSKAPIRTREEQDWSSWVISLMLSLATFLVAGFFLHGIGFRFIWVLCGLALAMVHLPKSTSAFEKSYETS